MTTTTHRPFQTLRGQSALNLLMRGVLATPLLQRTVSNRVLTIDVVGRRSGHRYRIPVGYTPFEGTLLIGTAGRWRVNLDPATPVRVRAAGRTLWARPEVVTDKDECARLYTAILAHNPVHGRFAKIGTGADGRPDPDDLAAALSLGVAVVRLVPLTPESTTAR